MVDKFHRLEDGLNDWSPVWLRSDPGTVLDGGVLHAREKGHPEVIGLGFHERSQMFPLRAHNAMSVTRGGESPGRIANLDPNTTSA